MKKAAIISVGTEIMQGKITDTNSTFISQWLNQLAIEVCYRINVADQIDEIVHACHMVKEMDFIIFTGGLGPTEDDLTRNAVAKFLKKELIFSQDAWDEIQSFFKGRSKITYQSNKQQAYILEGSLILNNHFGTAPGIYYQSRDQHYILLPGPPPENQPMLKNVLEPLFFKQNIIPGKQLKRIIRIYKMGESRIADLFQSINNQALTVGYYFTQKGWVEIHFTQNLSHAGDQSLFEHQIKPYIDLLIKNQIFFTEDYDLSDLVLQLLIKQGLTLSFAESITGGHLSAEMVQNSGASRVFQGGVIAYSNALKIELLNVSRESLDQYGAVSEPVVTGMVKGLKEKMKTNICISISGIAGPEGGSPEKPVGLVYFGFLINDHLFTKKEIFLGNRSRVIRKCINYAYCELYSYLKSNLV